MDEAHDERVPDASVDRILDQAVSASNIQIPEIPQEVGSLGNGTGALLVAQMLANAGMVVELVGGNVEKEDDLFEFVQIVDDDILGIIWLNLKRSQRYASFQRTTCSGSRSSWMGGGSGR